jgi:Arc/MetJ family transcription regulator
VGVGQRVGITRDITGGIIDALSAIVASMARTTIDVDDEQLAAAARELGTTSKVDTVNAALAYVAQRRRRAEAFDDSAIWGSPDLADPEVRGQARR